MPTPDEVIAALNKLASTRVLIGIPSESPSVARTGETETSINNATLGYIHEMGSPARNIPARPFLRPGVANSQDKWEPYLKQAAQAALQGNDGRMNRALNAAGLTAVSAVKATITAGIPPPIKPASMAARARYRGGKTPRARQERAAQRAAYRGFHERYEAGIETSVTGGDVTPLVDTAQLLNSITYVVKQNNE